MKKFAFIFALTLMMTIAVFADDGHTHNGGGRNCPPEQTCLIDEGDGSTDLKNEPVKDFDFIDELLGILNEMFG